jgi:hypothetical protein
MPFSTYFGRLRSRLSRPGGLSVATAALSLLAAVWAGAPPASALTSPASPAPSVPRLGHVFLIMEENNGFHDVIGDPAEPNLNHLAKTFGIATDYFGINGTSEPNYVAILGGNTFGINSDDAYWKEKVHAQSLISQLDRSR